MANKIVAVLRTPTLREALRDNADTEVRKLSWAPAADKLEKIYAKHLVGVSK
jgi:glycosyltransferase involved in cell wall biosynthesis